MHHHRHAQFDGCWANAAKACPSQSKLQYLLLSTDLFSNMLNLYIAIMRQHNNQLATKAFIEPLWQTPVRLCRSHQTLADDLQVA